MVGGDAFLCIDVRPGHEVLILGYWDEPYARIAADGTVAVNRNSPSVLQNTSRYGVAAADRADPNAEPRWEPTGDRASFVWHDHRSHWMAPADARTVDDDGLVQRWEVPLVIDGEPATVSGSLYRHRSPSGWWWLPLLVAAALAAARPAVRAPMVASLGAFGATSGLVDLLSLPNDARPSWAPIVLGAIGAIAGSATLRAGAAWWRAAVLAGAGAAVAIMGALQRAVLSHTYLPGPSPDWLVRIVVAASIGAGIVTALTAAFASTGIRFGPRRPQPASTHPVASGR